MRPCRPFCCLTLCAAVATFATCAPPASTRADGPPPLAVLMLGSKCHHRPADMVPLLTPALAKVGIDVTYVEDVRALTPARLAKFDVVAIYRDDGDLPAEQEAALIDFVEGGKGLVAIHCASHCFRNSDRYTTLVGGRFHHHGTGTFRARILDAQHPAMAGVHSYEGWDETYVHDQLAADILVLMGRDEGGRMEPYTWVRRQGKGRVYYTALGHDERAWKDPAFHRLIEQGIRWAAGRANGPAVKPFEYVEANVPNYLPGKKWGTIGEPIRRMQKPLEPAESMKHMHLPEGFEIKLYAAEPDIARPIAMTWDERGRLWIAETVDYPNNLQPPGKGHDRITICEDTDGDGRADKFTVFADKLSIPTSLAFANGGVVVTQAPDTLFLKSSKGDDKADVRRVLFSGWGTQDTHAGPSNLRRGPDNWLWGTVGYSGFRGTVGGKAMRFGQGVFRMRPDGGEMEFLGSTSNNTWGLGLSESGDVFGSTANNEHSFHLALPNRAFESVRGWSGRGLVGIEDHKKFHPVTPNVRQVDWHGGFTAAAGHALYTARGFPREYWDRTAFVCEPTGHLVHVDNLVSQGSAFAARDGWNILASDDEWTAPIAAEVGPDGALWVIDWYNFIVQHNPTPAGFATGKGGAYETPLRDKTHGRIYRIVWTGAKESPLKRLDPADKRGLIAALGNENLFWRQTAERLLIEHGTKADLPALAQVVNGSPDSPAARHALGVIAAVAGSSSGDSDAARALRAALVSSSPAVRRAALTYLPRNADSVKEILRSGCLTHEDAHVRLDALLALSEMPGSPEAGSAVAAFLREPRNASDRWLPGAAISAAAASALPFLAAVARPGGGKADGLPQAARVVAGHLARQAPADSAGPLLAALAEAPPAIAEAMLTGLAGGWPAGKPVRLDARGGTALDSLPGKLTPNGLLQLATLVKRWGQDQRLAGLTAGLRKGMLARLADAKSDDEERLKAGRDLLELGADDTALAAVLAQITPQSSPALTRGVIETLGDVQSDALGRTLVGRWDGLTPAARPALLAALLRRPAWTRALLDGLEKGTIDKSDLNLEQVQLLSKHPDAILAARATKLLAGGGRLPNADRQKVLDAFLPAATKHGDRGKGRTIFEANCAKCHRHGALGQSVGPDLTGVGARPRADVLIDILDPNRSVEGNYRQYTVETKRGQLLTGLLTAETKTYVELLDSEARRHVVQREDVESVTSSKLSLMPEGFERLGADDLVSLLEFLTARDRYFPLPLGKAATIDSVRGMFYDRANEAERLVFRNWGPQTVAGVPFQVLDPRGGSLPNVILLNGPEGTVSRAMPKSVSVPCNGAAKTIHILGGVSGWGFPLGEKGSVSLIVRLHYKDGRTEDHALKNGVHLADYIRVVDVPGSKLAFTLNGRQVRYLTVTPEKSELIESIEFVKGPDRTAPLVVAVTVEAP
jgi:putative membrane-bound dehydrogenase-like protein